jgi:hypothetical protein
MNDTHKEIIVTYNAQQLGYDPHASGGLEDVLALFDHDPKPDAALYVQSVHYGVSLGAIIAMYTTDDPHALVSALKEHYGSAISIVEEGGPMEAYAEPEGEPSDTGEEPSE